jgi:hypothetical protein
MSERIKNIADMLVGISEFDNVNNNDYKTLTGVLAAFTVVRTAIASINTYLAIRISGEKSRAVEQKSVLRSGVRRKMKDIARTARAVNINDAGFQRLFRIPDGNSDQILIASAREFIAKATEHKAAFIALGMPETLIADLETDVNALEQANNEKSAAQTKTVGATAEIDKQIDLAMDAAVIVNAAMQNVYRDNPAKLAEWASARHIKRTKRSVPKTPPANP